ncbi:MAG: TetR/AcrR family transcriptional regulator [Mycobacteriaceae bacterium]
MTTSHGLSRRDQRRAETIAEIKFLARKQLATQGPSGLSLRGIARSMRMSSAAIYRYFDNQHNLIAALCLDAYLGFGQALDASLDATITQSPTQQWWHIGHAIRGWSNEKSEDFSLLFGTPIKNFHAPSSATGPAAAHNIHLMLNIYIRGIASGDVNLERCYIPDVIVIGELGRYLSTLSNTKELTALNAKQQRAVMSASHYAWSSILGFITSERFGNLPRLIKNVDDLYDCHLKTIMHSIGFNVSSMQNTLP